MKSPKLVLASICLFASLAAFSQTDTTKSKKDTTTKKDTATVAIQQATTTASVQEAQGATGQQLQATNGQQATSSVQQPRASNAQQSTTATTATKPTTSPGATTSKESTPKANFGRYYIPVLGSYQSSQSTGDSKSVTITGDESNPGKVWIEGLTATKFYALLKAVPGTYKIPAQKQDENSVQEGTVIYDESSKQINICLGCGYQDNSPSDALTSSNEEATKEPADKNATAKNKMKVKKTVVSFSGTKSEQGTATINK